MNQKDKKSYIDRYNRTLDQFGYSPKALGWSGGTRNQELRFRGLMEVGIKNGDSILDVGCGFADLYNFLKKEKINCRYSGLDINENLLEIARQQYNGVNVATCDILAENYYEKHDWVVSCGIFNAKIEGEKNEEYIEKMVSKMFDLSNKGIAVDFLSTYVDYQQEGSYHFDPAIALRLMKSLSNKVVLRMDYLPYEYVAYCYKCDYIK